MPTMPIDSCIQYHKCALDFELEEIERTTTESTIAYLERLKRLEEKLANNEFKPSWFEGEAYVSKSDLLDFIHTDEEW